MQAAVTSLVLTVIGCFILWQSTDGMRALTSEGARRVAVTRNQPVVPNIKLETMLGTAQNIRSEMGTVTMVEFIYTTCPTICQTAGGDLAQIQHRLIKAGMSDQVRIISVSFDPVTDNIDELKRYAKIHGADGTPWTVARPSQNILPDLLKFFGVVVIPDEYGGYAHNAALIIIGKDNRLKTILDTNDIKGAVKTVKELL